MWNGQIWLSLRIVAEILIFQLVNYFNNSIIVIYKLLLKIVKFDQSLVAEILMFPLVNFDYFLVKNDYLSSENRTRWIVRVKKMTYFRLRD